MWSNSLRKQHIILRSASNHEGDDSIMCCKDHYHVLLDFLQMNYKTKPIKAELALVEISLATTVRQSIHHEHQGLRFQVLILTFSTFPNLKVVIFLAVVAVAVCAPADEESAKQKRGVLGVHGAYPGGLAAPWGWNGAYPYATGAWNGAYPYGGAWNGLGYPYAGLSARLASPWASALTTGAVVV